MREIHCQFTDNAKRVPRTQIDAQSEYFHVTGGVGLRSLVSGLGSGFRGNLGVMSLTPAAQARCAIPSILFITIGAEGFGGIATFRSIVGVRNHNAREQCDHAKTQEAHKFMI